jgi:hypothetical protein
MHDSLRHDRKADALALLARMAESLERQERRAARLERRFDEFARIFLEARFPHGQPDDRWARRGRGAA